MNPRKPLASWQEFAQGFGPAQFGFAMRAGLRNDMNVPGNAHISRVFGQDCYPFPSPWPDPLRVRSFFSDRSAALRRVVAVCVNSRFFQFASALVAVESAGRTTTKRGSSKCRNRLSLSPFSPCRWLAACRTPRRVGLRALPLVPPLPTLLTTTPSLARLSVALRALQPAASIWACRPATDLIAAFAAHASLTASRGIPSAGRLHFDVSVRAATRSDLGREPCSRKS
jgi:hypothetical protein